MNSDTHMAVGACLAALDNILEALSCSREINLQEVVGSAIAGAGAAILPDIFEPATNPNHRSFFHSVAISSVPTNYLRYSIEDSSQQDPLRRLKRALAIGYLSHLALDIMTPKRLPLLA